MVRFRGRRHVTIRRGTVALSGQLTNMQRATSPINTRFAMLLRAAHLSAKLSADRRERGICMQPQATARRDVGDVAILITRLSKQLAALAISTVGGFQRAYRPERHYMRGPGPKCRQAAQKTRGRIV